MTINTYLLSLAMSINGTAQFLAIVAGIAACVLYVLKHVVDEDIECPRWLGLLFWVAVAVCSVVPSKDQILAAAVLEQGPEVAKQLIEALK